MNVKKSRARTKIGHLVEMGGVRYSVFLALIVVLPQHVSLNLFCSLSPLECEITRIWGGLHCAVLAVQVQSRWGGVGCYLAKTDPVTFP